MPRLEPSAALGKPPKKFSKKRSVGVFACLGRANMCFEILRARTTSQKEDIYIIPFPNARTKGFHESIHESGKVHWVWECGKVHKDPLYGREDSPSALKNYIKRKSPVCICFRAGQSLTNRQIRLLVSRLIEFIPFDVQVKEICFLLKEKKFARFVRADFPRRQIFYKNSKVTRFPK